MNKLIFLIFCVFSLLIDFQVIAELKPTEGLIEQYNNFYFRSSLGRLNTLLNNPRLWRYLEMKGYTTSQKENNIFEDSRIADCFFDDKAGVINIILYFEYLEYIREEKSKTFIERREWFALKVYQIIMRLCREFIYEDISGDDIKLVIKHTSIPEIQGNTLFIWENGEVKYFPKFFDQNL